MIDFKLPELGENIESGDVVDVLVREGQRIEPNQDVLELETEKAIAPVPCPHAGVVKKLHVKKGDTLKAGSVLLTLEPAEAGVPAPHAAPQRKAEQSAEVRGQETEVRDQEAGGRRQEAGRGGAPRRGVWLGSEDAAAQVSQAEETTAEETTEESPAPAKPAKPEAHPVVTEAEVVKKHEPVPAVEEPAAIPPPASPETRRYARELGVDIHQVRGSGEGGRITKDDVKSAVRAEFGSKKRQTAKQERESNIERPTSNVQHPTKQVPSQSKFDVGSSTLDVERSAREREPPPASTPVPARAQTPQPAVGEPGEDAWGAIRRAPLSRVRETIALHMAKSASTIPHVTNFDDADITELERIRKGSMAEFHPDTPPLAKGGRGGVTREGLHKAGQGASPPLHKGGHGTSPPLHKGGQGGAGEIKLTMMPFVLKAAAMALKRHPEVNASLDLENKQIIYKDYVNLGVAVDTPRGLIVPVLREVDKLSIPQIARALAQLADDARHARFKVEDLRGGTFTISNLGAVGGTYSTPIINHPEVAVLLTGRSRQLPVVIDDAIQIRLMMPLSLSYDHRLVDGATAARFLNEVIDLLEVPGRLLLAP